MITYCLLRDGHCVLVFHNISWHLTILVVLSGFIWYYCCVNKRRVLCKFVITSNFHRSCELIVNTKFLLFLRTKCVWFSVSLFFKFYNEFFYVLFIVVLHEVKFTVSECLECESNFESKFHRYIRCCIDSDLSVFTCEIVTVCLLSHL
jgi:hypothetical protein